MRALARGALGLVQKSPPWRFVGRRLVLPRLLVIGALDDPAEAWRDVYPDYAARENQEAALSGAWIASFRGRGLGGLLLHPHREGFFLSALRVRWPARGLGVGRRLVELAGAWADASEAPVRLIVRPDNESALAIFRAAGFVDDEGDPETMRPGHVALLRPPQPRP